MSSAQFLRLELARGAVAKLRDGDAEARMARFGGNFPVMPGLRIGRNRWPVMLRVSRADDLAAIISRLGAIPECTRCTVSGDQANGPMKSKVPLGRHLALDLRRLEIVPVTAVDLGLERNGADPTLVSAGPQSAFS